MPFFPNNLSCPKKYGDQYVMTSKDKGHYAKKHPTDLKLDIEIAEALKKHISNGKISCAAAHKVAAELEKPPYLVGVTLDFLEARIIKCQLGLFGYHPEKKVVKPSKSISQEIERQLHERMSNDRLSCMSAWELAEELNKKRMEIASACEALKIKITPCQLGAF